METNEKKSANGFLRALHRDVGFFVIGTVLVYAASGIVLLHRNTGFLVRDVQIEKKLPPGLDGDELGKMLRLKGFKVEKTEGDVVHFREGTYNKATGAASYVAKELPFVLQKFVGLHKTTSDKIIYWYAMLFGILLAFLAISSFWMYPKGAGKLRRGFCIATAGVVLTIVVLLL